MTVATFLVDSAARVSVIFALALVVIWLLRARSASVRHWVLAAAVLCATAAPAAVLVLPWWHVGGVWPASSATGTGGELSAVEVESPMPPAVPPAAAETPVWPALDIVRSTAVVVWATGATLLLAVLATGLARLAWLGARATPVSDIRWTRHVTAIASAYGIRQQVRLRRSPHSRLLVTWGALRPTILVPSSSSGWTDERIRIVLAHELAHVARFDWGIQLVAAVVRSLHWCNPLAWLVWRRLRHEAERAADDAVLRSGVDGCGYADHLVELAREHGHQDDARLPALAMAQSSSLERRVVAMIDHRLNHGAITWMARGLTLAVAAAIALPVLAAQAGIGIVSGRVADETGLPIVGVTITLTNDATDSTVQAVTDETGHYVFEEVPSGRYVIGSRWTGFKMHSARVDVGANRTLEHDVTLAIGGLEETVEVSGLREPTPTGTSARFAPPRRVEPPPMPECEPSTTGGHVVPPRKTRNVPPSYPRDAIDRDANGIVILEATITTEGAVDDVGILRDPDAALSQAAIDAVSQWAFTPTLLNCEAVPVVMNVTVNYVLR